jgi:hypothetical protein
MPQNESMHLYESTQNSKSNSIEYDAIHTQTKTFEQINQEAKEFQRMCDANEILADYSRGNGARGYSAGPGSPKKTPFVNRQKRSKSIGLK